MTRVPKAHVKMSVPYLVVIMTRLSHSVDYQICTTAHFGGVHTGATFVESEPRAWKQRGIRPKRNNFQ